MDKINYGSKTGFECRFMWTLNRFWLESHHPRRHKIPHPCPYSSHLHQTLVPDAHVLRHHVRTAERETQIRSVHVSVTAHQLQRAAAIMRCGASHL